MLVVSDWQNGSVSNQLTDFRRGRGECVVCGQEYRRKIRLIEGNAKCRHLKKLTYKRNFAAGVYLSEAQNQIFFT